MTIDRTSNESRTCCDRPGLCQEMLEQRYLLKDDHGCVVESPRQMFARVAREVAVAERLYGASIRQVARLERRFYELMSTGQFLPNSPTLMNAGRQNGVLSGCFVLPVPDSIDGIFDAIRHTALIQKAGGGTGYSFDSLRPTGDRVASSGGRTSGPISFMRVFAEATKAIQQGAFRRGANMGMMSVEHPDILKFITAKAKGGVFENFNLSVKVTDDFMHALSDRPIEPHMVINPRSAERYIIPCDIRMATYTMEDLIPIGHVSFPCFTIRDIWNMIVRSAHATGEPGICFIDRVDRDNPTPKLGHIEATNPCGEQPLLPYESCNLGSINIAKFAGGNRRDLDYRGLGRSIRLAVRLLDDVIDVNFHPIPQIRDMTLGNRKIGLGVMGLADTLVLLGIRYDSDEAVTFAEKTARFITKVAREASEKLAQARGAFPNWAGSVWDTQHDQVIRNATCTTIAPTGSISILAGCSSGIEPIFSLATKRRALDGGEFLEIHPLLEQLGRGEGWMTNRVRASLLDGVPLERIRRFPRHLAEVLVTAHEVYPEWHVRVQAAFQKHIDNAVSKTVNLPSDAPVEDVDRVFRLAYKLGCKGITVYRDNSQEDQTLSTAGKLQRSAATTCNRCNQP